jgi:hypothetical protein
MECTQQDYLVRFLDVSMLVLREHEREGKENKGETAVIIRLIGPQDALQNWMRSLLMRHIFSVVSFLPTQEIIDPGESTKKGRANIRCIGNDCSSSREKCESLFSRLSLTPRTLDQMQYLFQFIRSSNYCC